MKEISSEYEYRLPYSQVAWKVGMTKKLKEDLSAKDIIFAQKYLANLVTILTLHTVSQQSTDADVLADVRQVAEGVAKQVKTDLTDYLPTLDKADNYYTEITEMYKEMVTLVRNILA